MKRQLNLLVNFVPVVTDIVANWCFKGFDENIIQRFFVENVRNFSRLSDQIVDIVLEGHITPLQIAEESRVIFGCCLIDSVLHQKILDDLLIRLEELTRLCVVISHWGNYWSGSVFRIHSTLELIDNVLMNVVRNHPHGGLFVDSVHITLKLEGCQKAYDDDWILDVQMTRLYLQMNLFDQLCNETRNNFVILRLFIPESVCSEINRMWVVLLHYLKNEELGFYPHVFQYFMRLGCDGVSIENFC